jgi:hypothetical protein
MDRNLFINHRSNISGKDNGPLTVKAYELRCIPDTSTAAFQTMTGTRVQRAIFTDGEHLLRILSHLPDQSAGLEMRFEFDPKVAEKALQRRLRIFILVRSFQPMLAENLGCFLEKGPLSRFYEFDQIDPPVGRWNDFEASCDIVRREVFMEPLRTIEENPHALSQYYTIYPFEPNPENDQILLDRILHQVTDPVCISIAIEPVEVSAERQTHARYLHRLESLSHPSLWEDDAPGDWHLSINNKFRSNSQEGFLPYYKKDSLANDALRQQEKVNKGLYEPTMRFHLRVLTRSIEVAELLGSVMAESAFKEGSYRLVPAVKGTEAFARRVHAGMDLGVVPLEIAPEEQTETLSCYQPFHRMCHLATVQELKGIFRLPVASFDQTCFCMAKNTDPPLTTKVPDIRLGRDVELSRGATAVAGEIWRGIDLSGFRKHLGIFGATGYGKTLMAMKLALEYWDHSVPFILFEMAKTEYRVLKKFPKHSLPEVRKLARDLEIYSPGDDTLSPFRYNPLEPISGLLQDDHVEDMLACLNAAMPMGGPLPMVMAEGLEEVLEKKEHPLLHDLEPEVKAILSRRYSGEVVQNLIGAAETRLRSLTRRSSGRVFQCPIGTPSLEHLINVPVVMEMDNRSEYQACIMTLFFLKRLIKYLKTRPNPGNRLRYIVMIEEAHVLLGLAGTTRPSEDNPDPKGHVTAEICKMLAELRALGVGVVIINQSPAVIAPEVLKHLGSKMAFRLLDTEDRQILGQTMLMGNREIEELVRLRPGQGYFLTEGYYRPRLIETCNLHDVLDLTPILGRDLLPWIQNDPWYGSARKERLLQELGQLMEEIDALDRDRLALNPRIAALRAEYPKLLSRCLPSDQRARTLSTIIQRARSIRHDLLQRMKAFTRGPYRMLQPESEVLLHVDKPLQAFHADLIRRVNVINGEVQDTLKILDQYRIKCSQSFSM